MTTASRPTFDPARGGKSKFESDMTALTKHYSSRDLPGHMTVKYRESAAQSNTSLKRDLEARERGVKPQSGASAISSSSTSQTTVAKRARTDLLVVPSSTNPDADDPNVVDKDEDEVPLRRAGVSKTTDDDEDDEEDETALLLAELERIKKEREIESTKREADRQAEEERSREEALVRGNPLLNGPLGAAGGAASFTVKKRWDDDTVFKNCARGLEDAAAKRKRVGYVNDTLRSEFHKRFMDKFIK